MLVEIMVAVGGYCLPSSQNSVVKMPSAPTPLNRSSDAIGAAGEATAQAELRKTLFWLCGNEFYFHEGPLVIEHAPGTQYPTAEIDHIAVTSFGIFIFETKNRSGHIAPSTARLTHVQAGRADRRPAFPDPSKPPRCDFSVTNCPRSGRCAALGYSHRPRPAHHFGLSTDLLAPADLRQWLRMQRDAFAGAKPICVEVAKKAVLLLADDSQMALRTHKATVI